MIENVQSICVNTAYACAAGVGAAAVAYGALRGMKFLSGGVKCLAAASLAGALIFGGMTVTSVYIAGAKTNNTQQVGGDLTNDVTQAEGATNVLMGVQGRARIPAAPQCVANGESHGLALRRVRGTRPTVTDDDIAAGWRLVSMSSNALAVSTFTMPEGATVWESAQACGRGWGAWHIPIGGWQFTYDDDGWTNGFVWVEGYFRSKFRSRANEIRLLSERLALCPAANWSRYNLAASRAWCATNDVDGLVVTFENAAIGDDPMKIASVQMELFPHTGEVALRYDLANVGDAIYTAGLVANGTNHFVEVGAGTREVVFQRVHPDDWDMDGLPNSIDDNPRVPSPNTGYNQTDAWAMAAFPSNATDIASVGYVAWVAARAAEPNRHLIGLQVSSPENVWPICLTFGDIQVMCDGPEMLYFAIDDGARYSFELSDGALAAVDFDGTEMLDGLPVEWYAPWEYQSWPCMVTLHVDSARSGWVGRTAEVSVEGLDDSHFFPNGNETVTAVVTNCHEDAYIDCSWSGGEGISFSDNHSLSTTIYWNSTNGVAWATNYVDLVTTYEGGYAITNSHGITVGTQTEPSTEFSLACQKVFFVNENEYEQETYVPNYMPERIRPVTVGLRGEPGLRGSVSFTVSEWSPDDASSNEDGAVLFQVVDGVTNRMFSTSVVPLEIEASCIGREDSETVLMSCPSTGKGVLLATLTLTNGCVISKSAPFKVVNPIRRLVTTEKRDGRPVNPSRLVWGTNAVLHVEAFGGGDGLSPDDVHWRVLEGPGVLANSNGFYNVVTPTAETGVVKIEARMNDDEIQPTFELPIVMPRVVPIRVFVVDPPNEQMRMAWGGSEIQSYLDEANWIFQQVGIRFEMIAPIEYGLSSDGWTVGRSVTVSNSIGGVSEVIAPDACRLLQYFQNKPDYVTNDCIEVYFTGTITEYGVAGYSSALGIVVSKLCSAFGFAHELGHALGLNDSYPMLEEDRGDEFPPVLEHRIPNAVRPVDRQYFCDGVRDWGRENGRGFYSPTDRRLAIGTQMLMYGFDTGVSHWDIPDGKVESLFGYGDNPFITVNAKVGADHIKKTNAEVYTK